MGISYISIPSELVYNKNYQNLSGNAIFLYALMRDRVGLSRKNGYVTEKGEPFVIFTKEEICTLLRVSSKNTASKIMDELIKIKLVTVLHSEVSRANLYMVHEATGTTCVDEITDNINYETNENDCGLSGLSELVQGSKNESVQDLTPIHSTSEIKEKKINSNIYISNPIDMIPTKVNQPSPLTNNEKKNNVNHILSRLVNEYGSEAVGNIKKAVEIVWGYSRNRIYVAGKPRDIEHVRAVFASLNEDHYRYVLDCVLKQEHDILRMERYLITSLFNAPSTIDFYRTTVERRKACGNQGNSFNNFTQHDYANEVSQYGDSSLTQLHRMASSWN